MPENKHNQECEKYLFSGNVIKIISYNSKKYLIKITIMTYAHDCYLCLWRKIAESYDY